jgi:hypothetical protein
MYEFIFHGDQSDFDEFKALIAYTIPNSGFALMRKQKKRYYCTINNDADTIFKVGAAIGMSYYKTQETNRLRRLQFALSVMA